MAFTNPPIVLQADIRRQTHIRKPIVTQNDDVVFEIEVFENGQPFDLTGATTISLANKRKRDGVTVVTVGSAVGNVATFALGTNELEKTGEVFAKAQFYDEDERVSTLSFAYMVESDPTGEGYIPSVEEMTLIETVLQDGPLAIQGANDAAAYANEKGDFIASKEELINTFTGEQTNLQAQIDVLVVDGDSSPESAQARVGSDATTYPTLKARLDAENNSVTTQLAETQNEVTEVDVKAVLNAKNVTDINTNLNFMKFLSREIIKSKTFIVNGDFATNASWGLIGATSVAENNTLKITKSGTGLSAIANQVSTITATSGRKIYVRAKMTATSSLTVSMGIRLYGSTTTGTVVSKLQESPIVNKEYVISDVLSINTTNIGNVVFQLYTVYSDNELAQGATTNVSSAFGVDLTAIFGAGKEPTKQWCDENFFFNTNAEGYTIYIITDVHLQTSDTTSPWVIASERERRFKSFVQIANADKPNLVVHLGDVVQGYSSVDWNIFRTEWNKLTQPKIVIPGNHDFDGGRTFEQVATELGYQGRPIIAGNKFNHAFTTGLAGQEFLVINLDTNTDYSWAGKLDQARLDWVSQQLNSTQYPLVLLMSHAPPHTYPETYFEEQSALQLKTVIDNALISNPKLRQVYGVHGHRHPTSTYESTVLGSNFKGLVCKGNVDANAGSYTKITIDASGGISWESRTL